MLTGTESTQTIQQLSSKIQELEKKLAQAPTASPASDRGFPEATRPCIRGLFAKTLFCGQSHWMHCIPPFVQIINVQLKVEADPTSEHYRLLQKCKNASREIKALQKIVPPVVTNLSEFLPGRDLTDRLVKSYLETFEFIFPVLHIPIFFHEYETFWLDPKLSSHSFVTKLLLIAAIGTIFQPPDEASFLRSSALQWIHVAQSWLTTPVDKTRLSTEGLQQLCLLLLARLAHDVDGDVLDLTSGYLLRAAMQMGFHIDAATKGFRELPPLEIQLRRKLWATVLEIVVQTSMDSGVLPLISASDYDCKPPMNVDDITREECSDDFHPAIQPPEQFTRSSLQIMLLRSLPLRLEIASALNDFRPDSMTHEKVMHFSEKLLAHCHDDSALLRRLRKSSSKLNDFHINTIELLTHRSLLALNYLYAIKAKSDHSYYFSRKICLDAALVILTRSPQDQDNLFSQLRVNGGGIFRWTPLQAVCFIADELIHHIETGGSSFTEQSAMRDRRDALRKHLEDYTKFTLVRIRKGHPNVRPNMMLSAFAAQLDAMLNGSSVEESIDAAIKTSLTNCYKVLCGQLGESPSHSAAFEIPPQMQQDTGHGVMAPLQNDLMVRTVALRPPPLAH